MRCAQLPAGYATKSDAVKSERPYHSIRWYVSLSATRTAWGRTPPDQDPALAPPGPPLTVRGITGRPLSAPRRTLGGAKSVDGDE
ncbi:hypothetical protein GCM10027073_03120 [Streptomyces chlorus]